MTLPKVATNYAASEALQAARYAEGDHQHITAAMALGGFQTMVKGKWLGPDGRAWRPGVRCASVVTLQPVETPKPHRRLPDVPGKPKRTMDRRDTVLRLLITGPKTSVDLREALHVEANDIYKALRRVVNEGLMVSVTRSRGGGVPNTYVITEAGRAWLERARAA